MCFAESNTAAVAVYEFSCACIPSPFTKPIICQVVVLEFHFTVENIFVHTMSSFTGIFGASNQYGRWVPEQELLHSSETEKEIPTYPTCYCA